MDDHETYQSHIEELILFAKSNFKSFHLFFPDEPIIYTLLALGYSSEESKKKMKKQNNWLRNKIQKALLSNGIVFEKHSDYILDWKSLSKNNNYNSELENVNYLFEQDA